MTAKTIILDLDGTILDTLADLTDSVNYALEKGGFPTHTQGEIRTIVGNGARNLIFNSLPTEVAEENTERILSYFKEHYEVNKTNKTAPYDGILSVLKTLKDRGCKLGIVSNKPDFAVRGLYELFFSDVCSFALGNCDAFPKKPAPDMVHYAIEQLSGTISDSVYIGDSEVDILTAKNSGIPCISVTWGFRDRDLLISSGAKILVDEPCDLISAINNL